MPQSILTAQNALNAAISASRIAKELGDSCPPARAAASLLLSIFQAIQTMKTNQADCYRLAQRCLDLLLEIKDQMGGSWETAPIPLRKNLHKFEQTLNSIYRHINEEIQSKWHSRIFRKAAIGDAIAEFNAELEDAARSFQISSLLNIHYAVDRKSKSISPAPSSREEDRDIAPEPVDDSPTSKQPIDPPEEQSEILDVEPQDTAESASSSPQTVEEGSSNGSSPWLSICALPLSESPPSSPLLQLQGRGLSDDDSYRMFHQSDVVLEGSSRIKDGWWAGTLKVRVEGQAALLKRYEGAPDTALKRWMWDINILRLIRHPNLPESLGFSEHGTPTPFIILAEVNTRSLQLEMKNVVKTSSIATCVRMMLRLYQDIIDAALYLQTRLDLSNAQMQDYIENTSYRVNPSGRVIIGLPPGIIISNSAIASRDWLISQSIREILLQSLPDYVDSDRMLKLYRGIGSDPSVDANAHMKVRHLIFIAHALLQADLCSANALPPHIPIILNSDPPTILRQIRGIAISHSYHEEAWEVDLSPSVDAAMNVGDVICVDPCRGIQSFEYLFNALADGDMGEIVQSTKGWQAPGESAGIASIDAFRCCDRDGWVIDLMRDDLAIYISYSSKLEPSRGWNLLQERGTSYAGAHDVLPENIMLVTGTCLEHRFKIQAATKVDDVNSTTTSFLFTSPHSNKEPVWSRTINPAEGSALPSSIRHELVESLRFVQLHKEDFALEV